MGLVMAVCTAGLAWQVQRHMLSPHTCFALTQGVLGLYGVAFPWLLQGVDHLFIAFAPATESGLHHGLRLAMGGLLLLPPSCLIGAIFPLLSSAVTHRQQDPAALVQWYQRTLTLRPRHQLARANLQVMHEWSAVWR
jgi:hypothetical protein